MKDNELRHLLKHGGSGLEAFLKAQERTKYPESFTAFMDQMIREHKVKRKDIAIRSGLSQDYTYKLLREDKKTTERDYILAIALAVGMNLPQVQHALRIYGMPLLDKRDMRSHVIMIGFEDGCGIGGVNGFLEKSGFPYIKTSPDMPSAEIHLISQKEELIDYDDDDEPALFTELERNITAERCWPAPMDYLYRGVIRVKNESDGSILCVCAEYSPSGDHFYVETEEERERFEKALSEGIEWDLTEEEEFLELFESLEDAAASPFFHFYLELDRATDDKLDEVLASVNDSKENGVRIGMHYAGGKKEGYLEAFNTQFPERNEYFQIIRTEEGYTYSVTHESLYMQIELGDLYPAYFGKKKEPYYVVHTNDLLETAKVDTYYKFVFTELRHTLNEALRDHYQTTFEGDEIQENIDLYAQQAAMAMRSGNFSESIRINKMLYELCLAEEGSSDLKSLATAIITAWKIANGYGALNDDVSREFWHREALKYDGQLDTLWQDGDDYAVNAGASLMDSYMYFFVKARNVGDKKTEADNALRALEWGKKSLNEDSAFSYINALAAYAFEIDSEDPEKAIELTGEAICVIRKYHLENDPSCIDLVSLVLNNHAWVLWNRLASEEAVIYYGQEIDLVSALFEENDNPGIRQKLNHAGHALYGIYCDTGREKEKERLVKRFNGYGIDLTIPEER
ncbi:MAG: hypothetical protein IJM69_07375 [Firmicutes bacterium]|nr:hypothetical protein [Bacillota bacterium]